MFIPVDFLGARNTLEVGPQACRPFTLQSSVCVGDLIAIVACGISGVGFFFWSIHAIRKMRQFPFNYASEDDVIEVDPDVTRGGIPPFHVPPASDDPRGVAQTLTLPERVETRLALSRSEEPSFMLLPPIVTDTTLRMPTHADGHSHRSSLSHSSSLGSPLRGGSHVGTYYGNGMDNEHSRNVSPSRARGSPSRRAGSDRGDYQPMKPTIPDPVPYINYYTR